MNVSFACPKCERSSRVDFDDATTAIACAHCGYAIDTPPGAIRARHVTRCVVCPSTELFVRKDFPQRLGAAIVIAGLAASCIPWYFRWWLGAYAILFATALIDVALYFFMGDVLECYRCHAQYRGTAELDRHPAFSLEVHERHRQQEIRARGAKQSAARSSEPENSASSGSSA